MAYFDLPYYGPGAFGEPLPPPPVEPDLIPGPRGFSRVWEQSMAPLADMPWYPMRGRGANFVQGFIRGSAGAARARGMGREQENKARAQAAAAENEKRLAAYTKAQERWYAELRDASKRLQEKKDKESEAQAKRAAEVIPYEMLHPIRQLRLGKSYAGKAYTPLEWERLLEARTSPDKPEQPKEPEPQRLTPAQEMEAAANPMEIKARLWDQRVGMREPLPENATAIQRLTPTGNRPFRYPGAADSAANYRTQAEQNREAVRSRYRSGGAATMVPQTYDSAIDEAQTKAELATVAARIKADMSLSVSEVNRLRKKVDARAGVVR